MSISPGSRLGPYQVLSQLGAGGMGEVYRAQDTRLAREVAIKVLPPEVSRDPSRLKRFEKEARSASALNHPNIVTIYDIGETDSIHWIAMEKVGGKTLREMLFGGALPVRKLLPIAAQIADGLARAHEAGIVHRDLKPENVMVTKDGLVKILDFGLAKLTTTGSGSDEGSQLPTETGTSPGVVLGTVGYMSPEQAGAQPVDFRTDQFSFGSVLYELATGKRAFQKGTAVDTLSAILHEEPKPVVEINSEVPGPFRWIVERCLSKDPEGRYVGTRDLARDLADLQKHFSELPSGAVVLQPRRKAVTRRTLAAIAIGAGLVALGVFAFRKVLFFGDKTQVPSFTQLTFRQGNLLTARFAPDGKTVVYGAAWDGKPAEIFTVRTDSIASTAIGLKGADVLSVSSKGELAVLIDKVDPSRPLGLGTLARVPITGGTPREILENVERADWAPNGEDLAVVRRAANGRSLLDYPIGTTLYESPGKFQGIRLSPRGDLLAFIEDLPEARVIATVDRKGKRRVVFDKFLPNIGFLAWSPSGDEIVFVGCPSQDQFALYAVSLSGRVRVLISNAADLGLQDVASDGRLLVESGKSNSGIACLVKGEKRERELGWHTDSVAQGISEDGRFILFLELSDLVGIYLRKVDGTPPIRIGEGDVQDVSADGQWVLVLLPEPPRQLAMIPTGPGTTKKIPVDGIEPSNARLLPNGRGFLVWTPSTSGDLIAGVLASDGGKARIVETEARASDQGVVVSRNGERFAYVTKERRVRVVSLAGAENTTVPGAPLEERVYPFQWSADGRFIFLLRDGGIPTGIESLDLSTGKREVWKRLMPETPTGVIGINNCYFTPDGQSYVYSYGRILSDDLYVLGGVR